MQKGYCHGSKTIKSKKHVQYLIYSTVNYPILENSKIVIWASHMILQDFEIKALSSTQVQHGRGDTELK